MQWQIQGEGSLGMSAPLVQFFSFSCGIIGWRILWGIDWGLWRCFFAKKMSA